MPPRSCHSLTCAVIVAQFTGCTPQPGSPAKSLPPASGITVVEERTSRKPEPVVELRDVKYAELTALVKSFRGKVLVVDLWAEY